MNNFNRPNVISKACPKWRSFILLPSVRGTTAVVVNRCFNAFMAVPSCAENNKYNYIENLVTLPQSKTYNIRITYLLHEAVAEVSRDSVDLRRTHFEMQRLWNSMKFHWQLIWDSAPATATALRFWLPHRFRTQRSANFHDILGSQSSATLILRNSPWKRRKFPKIRDL